MSNKKPWQVAGLGCGSHLCVFSKPEGQGTNGPCMCFNHPSPAQSERLRMAFIQTKRAYENLEKKIKGGEK